MKSFISIVENQRSEGLCLPLADVAFIRSSKAMERLSLIPTGLPGEYILRAINIVGCFSLPSGTVINVIPKIGLPNLLRMLSFVASPLHKFEEESSLARDHGLVDMLGQMLASEATQIIRAGLRSEYLEKKANIGVLRGRLDFPSHISRNLGFSGKLSCIYSTRSSDSTENRALVAAVVTLLKSGFCRESTSSQLRSVLREMPGEIDHARFTLSQFNQISMGTHNAHYASALYIAKLVLTSTGFSHLAGCESMAGFLLDVSDLFEKYVAKASRAFLADKNMRVDIQDRSTYLDSERRIACEPDIVFRLQKSKSTVLVVDTKYKDPHTSVDPDDVRQMVAYMMALECSESLLLYPEDLNGQANELKSHSIPYMGRNHSIRRVAVPLSDPRKVAELLGKELIRISTVTSAINPESFSLLSR